MCHEDGRILPAGPRLTVTFLASYHVARLPQRDSIAEDGRWTAGFTANLHFAMQNTQYLND